MTSLAIGNVAPQFSSVDQNGKTISTTSFPGKYIVLYFYPRDNTPGCSIEAKKFRDLNSEFEKNNAVIIGVSLDSMEKHKSFAEDKKLPFYLISDSTYSISKDYETYSEFSIFGLNITKTANRDTFLIKDGKIINIWRNVSIFSHPKEVLDYITNLNNNEKQSQ